jgi:hypothetical protein
MLSEMSSFLCKRERQHALAFPHGGMMLFERSSCLCKREKLAHTSFAPRWDDV